MNGASRSLWKQYCQYQEQSIINYQYQAQSIVNIIKNLVYECGYLFN